MADRKPFVGGNWKMNLHGDEAVALAKALTEQITSDQVEVAVYVPFPYLAAVGAGHRRLPHQARCPGLLHPGQRRLHR